MYVFPKIKALIKLILGWAYPKAERKAVSAGYYLHCEPGEAFVGGGMWMPMPPELKKLRQEIDYHWDEFSQIITGKKFKAVYGDLVKTEEYRLSRPPKGYEETNPAIEYLKLKSFLGLRKLTDEELQNDGLVKTITTSFEALQPLLDFMNRAIEG